MARNKRLVLTFDAFGTLFTPRETIGKQYAEVARKHGLSGFSNDQIASSFQVGTAVAHKVLDTGILLLGHAWHANVLDHLAFKSEAGRFPNYGKAVGMNPAQWWSNIIRAIFRPFSSENGLPEQLVPDLLNRFSSAAGYMLYPDVLPFFKSLRRIKAASLGESACSKPIIGVITNSDDRVPSILSSFGLQVGLWRLGDDFQASFKTEDDINFVMLSYDVGFEKPKSKMFDITKQMVPGQERFLHVGDDLQKDYYAAKRAGWEGILLAREVKHGQEIVEPIPCITDLKELTSQII